MPRLALTVLSILALLSTTDASAQMRATLGLGAWTLRGESRAETSFSPVARFTTSIAYSWPLRVPFALRTEFGYTLRGADAQTELGGVEADATLNLTYLDLPFLLEWEPVPGGPVTIYAGPSVYYRLDARIRFRATAGGPEFTENDPTVRRTGWALVGGIEAAIATGDERVLFGLRGVGGVSNVRDTSPALRHAGAVLYAGVAF